MKKEPLKKVNIKMLPKFTDFHNKLMKDASFRNAYNNLDLEFSLIEKVIDARIKKNISQKELAKRLGTGQSAVSRLESGTYNPSYKFLQKLAKALDSKLVIEFK